MQLNYWLKYENLYINRYIYCYFSNSTLYRFQRISEAFYSCEFQLYGEKDERLGTDRLRYSDTNGL